MLDLRDFAFPLPDSQIAKFPASPRDSSRLLITGRDGRASQHAHFRDLPQLLLPGDVLVLNKTKVLKARLRASNEKNRAFEILLLTPLEGLHRWQCLVKPGRYIADPGSILQIGNLTAHVQRSKKDPRQFEITFPLQDPATWLEWLELHGEIPLPPYLKREVKEQDSQTYQTIYAEDARSVAAPTAGLHFTPELLDALKKKGVQFESLTLDIGYGTFSPVEATAQELHSETYCIPDPVYARLAQARRENRRVIAVGTTALRALESAAQGKNAGETRLFIRPGYSFSQLDGLITNFHLPEYSLFILVCAFMGTSNAQRVYREAIEMQYRFFSYGDAMAIL
jgi:S-adenosylmethionine:tRNA ribosyltransferase-isomerase